MRAKLASWTRAAWPPAILLLLAYPLILHGIGSYSVVNADEALFHSEASAMVASGDWLSVTFKGEPRYYDAFMYSAAHFWVRALLISALGENHLTMRLLSALFGVASILMTYRLVLYMLDRKTAMLAALIQLTTLQFVYLHSARTGEFDTGFTFLLTIAAYFFLRAIEDERWFVPHHLALIGIMNTKLPLVIVPLTAAFAYFLLVPTARPHFRRFVSSAALLLPVGLAWHMFNAVRLWDELPAVLEAWWRLASSAGSGSYRAPLDNPLYFARTIFFGAFPYSLVYPLAIFGVCRASSSKLERSRVQLLAVYLVALLIFHTFVGHHHAWYVIPAYPFLSAFLAIWLIQLPDTRPEGWMILGTAAVLGALAWSDLDLANFNPFAERMRNVSLEVPWRGPLGIHPAAAIGLTGAIIAVGLITLRRRLEQHSGLAVAASMTILLVVYATARVSLPLAYLGHQSEMGRLHKEINEARRTGKPIEIPIDVKEAGMWPARYYFADDFEIVSLPPATRERTGVYFRLYRRGDPAVLEHSRGTEGERLRAIRDAQSRSQSNE